MKLARAQRALLLVFGAAALVYASRFALAYLAMAGGGAWGMNAQLPLLLLQFLVWLLAAVFVARLARAAGWNLVLVVLAAVLMFVPLVNFLLILAVNHRATILLRRHGVRVGLLGVGNEELVKLVEGVCRGCGYSLEGLVGGVCPECGTAVE